MTRTLRVLTFLMFLVISCTTIAVGYATITQNLLASGEINVEPAPFFGVYISQVRLVSTPGISQEQHAIVRPTNLQTSITALQASAPTVTYEVTVHNNTDVSYWYLGTNFETGYGSNAFIGTNEGIFITTKDHDSDTTATFDKDDWIPPQTYRVFYVTYRFGTNVRLRECTNLINFRFGLHMDSVQDEFLNRLNDKNSANGYQYIADAFNAQYKENGSTVIGNIGNDAKFFDTLFGPNITVNVNGQNLPVTVMIERKNVDKNANTGDAYANGGPGGCEYTVYLTTDNLNGTVTVYAVSYTCDANGVWRQIGELYEGTCTTSPYEDSGKQGINVSSWDATPKVYQVTKDISYKVGYEQGTEYDKYDSIEELMSAKDQEFYNAVNNNSSKLLIPACLVIYSYRHNNGQWVESINTFNEHKPGYDLLKEAFDKIKPYCYIGNGAQEVKITNASALSRAELIRLLEAVQLAYDYYLSVN